MHRIGLTCIAFAALLSCSNGQQPEAQKTAGDAATPPEAEVRAPAIPPLARTTAPVEAPAKQNAAARIPDSCRYDGLEEELSAARALWQGTGINSYSMTIQRSAFFQRLAWPNSRPLKLVVRDGHATGNLPAVDPAWLQSVTVDGLFSYIETELAKHPDCLNVTFDSTFGFPTSIRIDPVFGGADDELEYEISEFGS